MKQADERAKDPLGWCVALAVLFALLAGWHLAIPTKMYFDEVHYVPAARSLQALGLANAEHPLVGKELIAAGIRLFGDRPLGWRLPSALIGTLGLFAFGRALWWASLRRFAAIAGMILLASDFLWFVQSRIAMLDMAMAGFAMIALWQVAAAARRAEQARWRLAIAGVSLGLALGAKWSVAPVLGALVVALSGVRVLRQAPWRETAAGGALRHPPPFPALSLTEVLFWLTSVPLAIYWLTFLPAFFYRPQPLSPLMFLAWHHTMFALQASVRTHHPYQSVWYQWIVNWRAIWYLYENTDGAWRGIVLIGNPFTMLAGLPAILWCLWAGWRGRADAAMAAALFFASLALWLIAAKPVQFYYHYLLPSSFLMAALALALDRLWQRADLIRWLAPAALALSLALFGWFYPILAAAPLHAGRSSFEHWMWLKSWR